VGPRECHEPEAACPRAAVEDRDPLPALALGYETVARLAGGLDRPRDPAGEVDRDDVLARFEQWLVDRDEVADRRL
jgi:hypothetical protein